MITNDRQYKITKGEAERFRVAIANFDGLELLRQGIDPAISEAQRASMKAQLAELEEDLSRYEGLRSSGGGKRLFPARISEIGEKLIEGRIMQGLSQKALAERLGMKEQQIQRYEQDRYMSANLARVEEVADALGLDLHAFFDVRHQRRIDLIAPNLRGFSGFDPCKLPVKTMRRLGWLDTVHLPAALRDVSDIEIAAAFISQTTQGHGSRALHLQRVRAGSKQDNYALTAWKAEVLRRARERLRSMDKTRGLDPSTVNQVVGLSRDSEGPLLAVQLLEKAGVVVVILEHLPATHLDGAAMLLDNDVPVIGLTLRFDRIDAFWWVLLHEIGHVVLHRESGLRDGFFDETDSPPIDKIEEEADGFARNAMIPFEAWNSSFVRFTASKDQIVQFAKNRGISPSIVAGRLRKERNDYTQFSELVGQGQVRKLFELHGMWGV